MNIYRTETPRWRYSPIPWFGVMLIAGFGLACSLYLAYLHYAVHTQVGYSSFCAYTEAVNCETVAQSRYSVFLGVPVAVWGVLGYVFVLLVSIVGVSRDPTGRRLWMLLYYAAAVSCVASLALGAISTWIIQSRCVICMATYLTNFLLFLFAMTIRSRRRVSFGHGFAEDLRFLRGNRVLFRIATALFGAAVVGLVAFFPAYWGAPPILPASRFETGLTGEGDPWIGAPNAKLTILEFSDYQCFYCRKAHFLIRDLLASYPGLIKVIHYQFPLDKRCNPSLEASEHEGSCDLAVWALSALQLGRFWEMNDALFEREWREGFLTLDVVARHAGLDPGALRAVMGGPDVKKRLAEEILLGARLGINATPAYLVDGKLYVGKIPDETIRKQLAAP